MAQPLLRVKALGCHVFPPSTDAHPANGHTSQLFDPVDVGLQEMYTFIERRGGIDAAHLSIGRKLIKCPAA